jgi:hypothetical protein
LYQVVLAGISRISSVSHICVRSVLAVLAVLRLIPLIPSEHKIRAEFTLIPLIPLIHVSRNFISEIFRNLFFWFLALVRISRIRLYQCRYQDSPVSGPYQEAANTVCNTGANTANTGVIRLIRTLIPVVTIRGKSGSLLGGKRELARGRRWKVGGRGWEVGGRR